MTPNQAIKQARKLVSFYPQGHNQWVLLTWSEDHNAWYQNNPTDWWHLVGNRKDALIYQALKLLGVEENDAGAEASVLSYHDGRWDDAVRDYVKKHK